MNRGVELPAHTACFVCGAPDDPRIHVRYFWVDEVSELHADIVFGPRAQGPPGHAHGGAIASVLDEAMGTCAWMNGHMVVAAHLDIDYRRPLALERPVTLSSTVTRVEGRKVHTRGSLRTLDGEVVAESTGIFVTVLADKMQGLSPDRLDNLTALERYAYMRETQTRLSAPFS